MWPHIIKFVVKTKKITDPKSKSYETISSSFSDPLMPACKNCKKIAFFASVATQMSPFLTSDKPMLPFVSTSLDVLFTSFMNRFMKSQLVAEATSVLKILKLKPTDKERQVDYLKVDVGFVAQQMLNEKSSKLSERQVLQFRVECKDFLARTVAKLLDKTPINY